MTRSRIVSGAVTLAVLLLLTSCAADGNAAAGGPGSQPGFLYGLWHGFITPVTFLISLFTDDVGIYEVRNNGAWYDFGYVLGLSFIFSGGGVGASARRR
ncbi:MAG TPA: hypothetical protein VFR87_07290 [Nocardioidaceae bacterium]|nr:hypothetical protein [Nocardioidaceae bacterium]